MPCPELRVRPEIPSLTLVVKQVGQFFDETHYPVYPVVPCCKGREVQQGDSEAGGKPRGSQLPRPVQNPHHTDW